MLLELTVMIQKIKWDSKSKNSRLQNGIVFMGTEIDG
jgi:hypothetical protein